MIKKDVVEVPKDKTLSTEDNLIQEAQTRFKEVSSYETDNRAEAKDDLLMLNGENHWDPAVEEERTNDQRPCLVINKLPGFVDQVTGDARVNKVSIKIVPYGGGASHKTANTLSSIIKGIENLSEAEVAYQTGFDSAVSGGFGYWRISTDYESESTFEQVITIDRVKNPFTVYMDPKCEKSTGEGCKFCFISELVSREEYEVRYPGKTLSPFQSENNDEFYQEWNTEDHARVAEYWKLVPKKKTLHLLSDGRIIDDEDWSKIGDEVTAADPNIKVIKSREIKSHKVVQYIIDGTQILEGPTDFPGTYIPVVRVAGKEMNIDGRDVMRSLIRFAKDPQRMYNYFRSSAAETVALAPRAPYLVADSQIEGYEQIWGAANRKNSAYLPYKHAPGVPVPIRQVVTQTAIGEITESNISNDEMKATTSLYDASLGNRSNEVTGKAIMARQSAANIANIIFMDNFLRAIKFTGKILVDLIPKIYDTTRQILVINEDETEELIRINEEVVDIQTGKPVIMNDLSIGTYRVTTTTGPAFATKRAEAVQAMMDFMRVAPGTAQYLIDIVAENMDWPGAAKIAARMRKLLPPGIIEPKEGDPPPPPQPPDLDKVVKGLKAESIELGNQRKRLEIADLSGENSQKLAQVAQVVAQSVLQQLTGMGGGEQGDTQGR